jgi:predicted SprT family Zn-dependent metalloprotease
MGSRLWNLLEEDGTMRKYECHDCGIPLTESEIKNNVIDADYGEIYLCNNCRKKQLWKSKT